MYSQNPNSLEKFMAKLAHSQNRLTIEKILGQLASAQNTKTINDAATHFKSITTADLERVLQSLLDPALFYNQTRSDFVKGLSEAYRFLQKNNTTQQSKELQGILGLVCFTLEMLDKARSSGRVFSSVEHKWLEGLLNDSSVQYWFYKIYTPTRLSDDTISSSNSSFEKDNWELSQKYWQALEKEKEYLQLYRVGTTSFVLRCQIKSCKDVAGRELILKCLLFPYTQIAFIAKATYDYAVTYYPRNLPIAHVHASTNKWILMDFIEGRTLQELLDERRQAEVNNPLLLRTDLLALVGKPLLEILKSMSDANVQHQDLTPSNIIVCKKPDGSINELKLIDLGRNYLYMHKIGIAENREALFVAPEVRDDSESRTSDLYSFGMLLIELANPQGVQDKSIPDSIYEYAPTLARFIEDLVDIEPKKRLLLFHAGNEKDIYLYLQQAFADELKVLSRTQEVESGRRFWVQQFKDLFWPADELKLLHLLRELRRSSNNRSEITRYSGQLFLWLVFCTSHFLLILAIVIPFWLRDFGFDNFPTFVNVVRFFTPGCGNCIPIFGSLLYDHPDFWGNLPARLTLCSVIAQTKYYQNILAGLTARQIRSSKLAPWAEITLRGSAVCSIGPILYCNLFQPRLWLFMLVLGYVTVGLNNILCYQLAIRLLKKAQGKLSTALPPNDPVLQGFRSWGSNMIVYMVFLLTISILLSIGWIHDEWIYVIGTVGVSIFIWCISRCILLAPLIRGRLSRAFIIGERLEALP